jgi:hypothetical protein
MNKQRLLVSIAAIALIAGTAGVLNRLSTYQKLGSPGIKATPIPGSIIMNINLPGQVLDYASTNMPQPQAFFDWLPKDTSYARRRYTAPDGFCVDGNIVLMGMDRTSIHKPEICMPGQGWRINQRSEVTIPIGTDPPYPLVVAKWVLSNTIQTSDGRKVRVGGLYVFWFVAENEQTASHWQRVWWLARDLLRAGVLQRWAYVSYFCICEPGKEDAAFERVKQLIAASVPEFQLPPKTARAATVAKQ